MAVKSLLDMAEYQVCIATSASAKIGAWDQAENAIHALITVSLSDPRITSEDLTQLQQYRKWADSKARKFK